MSISPGYWQAIGRVSAWVTLLFAVSIRYRLAASGRLLLLATLKFTPVVWLLLAESGTTRPLK